MAPQRDVYARLARERLPWMSDDQRRRMQDIAERLGRGLDGSTAVSPDGDHERRDRQIMQESLARRTYTMSLMAMVFLPSTFYRPVRRQPRRDPGNSWHLGFSLFCLMLVVVIGGVAWMVVSVNGCKEIAF
jgi:zinc transporter